MRSADDYNPHCQRRAPALRWVTGSPVTEATLLADELSSSRRRARFRPPGLRPFDQPVRPASLIETVERLAPRRLAAQTATNRFHRFGLGCLRWPFVKNANL